MTTRATTYWGKIIEAFQSLSEGLAITLRHFVGARKSRPVLPITSPDYFKQQDGISTIQYPHVILPVPDNGRYRLHNEIDDCIVCDKCAKICPVNCIDIEPVRAIEEIGKTSDGTSKRIYAAKFDIDMAKCCFCGLCTTVCPTECLTMTRVYDFSVSDIKEHNFAFAEMSPSEIEEKKRLLEEHQKSRITTSEVKEETLSAPKSAGPPKPVFKPKIKPPGAGPATT
jgi:formate hydrogenlyase subunit 6/NADH:ubiquinone oxidoreductase subunit I